MVRFVAQKIKFAPKNRAEETVAEASEGTAVGAGAVSDPFDL